MDKLKMHTPNIADENYKKLVELFPDAVTETVNENGEVIRAIDKDILMQEINARVIGGDGNATNLLGQIRKKQLS
ncbi:hypothetical protein QUW30_06075 [Ligilactobacillus salivarius]|uniref:hypothetical protein n=1 Tax=Ligilactobacillus salivarius TaxID=1624 RepID=UPI0025A42DDD|nr:hypothetical protein [Ligilactobacillus salivarius]MDM8273169.1 hypothetical protein [Ligilactobacillus salivarius]